MIYGNVCSELSFPALVNCVFYLPGFVPAQAAPLTTGEAVHLSRDNAVQCGHCAISLNMSLHTHIYTQHISIKTHTCKTDGKCGSVPVCEKEKYCHTALSPTKGQLQRIAHLSPLCQTKSYSVFVLVLYRLILSIACNRVPNTVLHYLCITSSHGLHVYKM